jgi:lipopolysaccharide export system permease protein
LPLTRRLSRYVTGELLPPLLLGLAMFSAVLSFGYFFVSAQFISDAPLGLIGRWLAYQLPDTLVKVMPMAVVLMVVVAFGRMATERELVAVQSGGVSLGRMVRPAAVLALLLTALSLWLSLWVAPAFNVQTRSLYWERLTGDSLSTLGGKTLDLGNNLLLNLGGYDKKTDQMQNVRIEQWTPGTQRATVIFAQTGTYSGNKLRLRGYNIYKVDYAAAQALPGLPITDPAAVRAALQAVFPAIQLAKGPKAVLTLDAGLSRAQTLAKYADIIGADAQGWTELVSILNSTKTPQAERDNTRQVLSRKLALPFANLVLALCALPFALRFGRSLGVALGVALLIALAYYLLFFVGLTVGSQVAGLSLVGAWLANVVFLVVGLSLLRRA